MTTATSVRGGAGLLLALVSVVGAMSLGGGASAEPQTGDARQVEMSVLHRTTGVRDHVPDGAREAVRQLAPLEDARLLTASEDFRFYAFPARDGRLCLLGEVAVQNMVRDARRWTHAITCEEPDAFAKRGAYLHLGADDRQYGVLALPDAAQVTVRTDAAQGDERLEFQDNHLTFGPFPVPGASEPPGARGSFRVEVDGESVELLLPAAALEALDART